MATPYRVVKINTTAGVRYCLFRGKNASHYNRTYYKKKSNAQKAADRLNKNL